MSQSQNLHHDNHGQPHTPVPRRYPSTLTLGHKQPLSQQNVHKYEGFEELLREAGYKETRVFTPPRERQPSPNPTKELETKKLGGVVSFLAGLIPRATTPTPTANPNPLPDAPPSPASIQSLGCASDDGNSDLLESPTTIKTVVPQPRRTESTATLNSQYSHQQQQPKYLRSQHLQAKRQFSEGAGLMPPVHQQLHQRHSYSHLNHGPGGSRPASPSPLSLSRPGTPHRPTTPHRSTHPSRTSSSSHVTPFQLNPPHQPKPLYPVHPPSNSRPGTPSKAHAYLRHMASARGIGLGQDDGEGEGEDTPRPLPRTKPKSKSSSGSSRTSTSTSTSTSASTSASTSSATTVDLESSGSSDEEDTGTYLRRMRSLSRCDSREEPPRESKERTQTSWERAMQAVGGRRILRHSTSTNTNATTTSTHSRTTTSNSNMTLTDATNLRPPTRPTTPYLVTRLGSRESRGEVERGRAETKVNVYCRSRSVPPPRKRGSRKGVEEEVRPVLVLHDVEVEASAFSAARDENRRQESEQQASIKALRRHLELPQPQAEDPKRSWSIRSTGQRGRGAIDGLWDRERERDRE
ncbi:hypothetical protein VNI00_012628 [Paramarasmius palmivorus]|uniref:Uncharacterized protein n=1 Tax=Paramarasmius palmivorus TaxID=297713 RepID=A0AAW0C3F4_9AGAR